MQLLGFDAAKKYEWLWGTEMGGKKTRPEDTFQSHLQVYDLIPQSVDSTKITRRDGIRINEETGVVADGAKYDYEILEPGIHFPLTLEITVREKFNTSKEALVTLAKELMATIKHDAFRLGAFTAQGFGRFDAAHSNLEAFIYDFTTKEHQDAWFAYLETGETWSTVAEPIEDGDLPKSNYPAFQIKATFRLKSALMIGASGGAKSDADKASIQSNGHYVIPGKSIRGAIRQRARRILEIWKQQDIQLSAADGKDLTSELFGFVKQDGTNSDNAQRGLIRVEETTIAQDAVKPMLQNRIRIDRFTGGVIDGALFNSEPVWTTDKEDLQLTFTIDSFGKVKDEATQKLYKKLLLMLLKDLWTGDLPIGGEKNIGRGVLQGKKATIIDNNKEVASFTWADEGKTAEALEWTNDSSPEKINALIA
jgi:CRISPR/Cas system CSM-associated protein Csm3 (group 7 of RAMP superfamily)